MTKLSCIILGENYPMLMKSTPNSRMKVNVLALALLTPTLLWAVTGFLLASEIKGFGFGKSMFIAAFMSALVFILESLIVRTPRNKTVKCLRITLGLFMALTGSFILDEWLFKEDIDRQLSILKSTKKTEETARIKESLAAQLAEASEEVQVRYTDWQNALENATREADGTGGSGNKGVSGITRMKMQVADQKKQEYQHALNVKEEINLSLDEKLTGMENELDETWQDPSLLTRMQAMFSLVFSNRAMLAVWVLITGILFILEFMVVILKSSWDDTPYEKQKQVLDELYLKRLAWMNRLESSRPGRGIAQYREAARQITQEPYQQLFN